MTTNAVDPVAAGLRTISIEQQGLTAMAEALGTPGEGGLGSAFRRAVETIAAAPGRLIVTGLGKSGHVGRKIAATFASTGQPAVFVHAAEASHGDLGMVQNGDVVHRHLLVGRDGRTGGGRHLRQALRHPADRDHRQRATARSAARPTFCCCLPNAQEACPNGLAPTTSTTMQLVLGDALAIALLEGRGFTARDFRVFHPGGKLGAKLAFVRDVMHRGDRIPRIRVGAKMADAIVEMTTKGFGCVGVFDDAGALVGIVTDGDLRRHLKSHQIVDTPVEEVMTRSPRTIAPDALVAEALELVSRKISALLVVEAGEVVGIIHFHDLLGVGAA